MEFHTLNMRLSIIVVTLVLMFMLIGSVGSVHADTITSPLNNSILNYGYTYNLTLDITSINSLTTSDTASIYINNSLVYSNTYTANGLYHIPIMFDNYGKFVISLHTTTTNQSITYTIPSQINNFNYIYYLNYFNLIIILWIIAIAMFFLIKKIANVPFLSYFVLILASIFSILYILMNTLSNTNLYYLSLSAFLLVFVSSIIGMVKDLF